MTRLLYQTLREVLGEDAVSADAADCALAGSDILPDAAAVTPELVVRPRDTDAAARAMQVLAEHGRAVLPRGAGLSYTGGVVPRTPSVAVDTSAMTAIRIIVEDLTAIVGAGCSWEAVAAALRPSGLQLAVAAPISGSHSTVRRRCEPGRERLGGDHRTRGGAGPTARWSAPAVGPRRASARSGAITDPI